MIPVLQSRRGHEVGNCLEACVASILECSLDEVLDVNGPAYKDTWLDALTWWCRMRGYAMFYSTDQKLKPLGYHIACGEGHAVVALDGRIVHCPGATQRGLNLKIEFWLILLPLGVVDHG